MGNRYEGLEDLIRKGIIEPELFKERGCDNSINSQKIGRGYYHLKFFIEQADRREFQGVSVKDIRDKIKKILDELDSQSSADTQKQKIGLREISDLDVRDNELAANMEFISLQHALNAFERSNLGGDHSPHNASYRGMCRVDLAKLNNRLNKHNTYSSVKELELAEFLLESVLNTREGGPDYKDYSRLAECKFRLAEIIMIPDRKKDLYTQAINSAKLSIFNFKRKEKSTQVKPELFSVIASSYYRLAGISLGDEKKRNLEEAVNHFDYSFKSGDTSTENRFKTGACSLKLLEIILRDVSSKPEEIDKFIEQTRDIFQDSLERTKTKTWGRNYSIYSLFMLYFLSKDVIENNISRGDLVKYGLREPLAYVKDALRIFTSDKELAIRRLSSSANFVCKCRDDYSLLNSIFIMKKGERVSLDKERQITEELRAALDNKLLRGRYTVPRPLCIIDHEDQEKTLSGSYYALSRKMGVTLEEFFKDERTISKDRKSEVLMGVADYLAFIHANIASGQVSQDYSFKLRERLAKLEDLSIIDSSTKKQIIENYSPILGSFQEATLVFNKDAHPGNWIITKDGSIVAIDFEDKAGSVPVEFDLVNLTGYGDCTRSRRDNLIEFYTASFERYSGRSVNYDETRYLNAFIHQAISVIATHASKGKDGYQKSIFVLNKMLDTLQELEERCSGDQFDKYTQLSKSFKRIRDKFLEINSND